MPKKRKSKKITPAQQAQMMGSGFFNFNPGHFFTKEGEKKLFGKTLGKGFVTPGRAAGMKKFMTQQVKLPPAVPILGGAAVAHPVAGMTII